MIILFRTHSDKLHIQMGGLPDQSREDKSRKIRQKGKWSLEDIGIKKEQCLDNKCKFETEPLVGLLH